MNYQKLTKKEYQKEKEKEIREKLDKELYYYGYFDLWLKNGTYIKGYKYELGYPYLMIYAKDDSVIIMLKVNTIKSI